MKDIEDRQDIKVLIDEFYKKVIEDELIGSFFTEIVQLDWNTHIPVMYDFWESTLLGSKKYKSNAMFKHLSLNSKKSLETVHFERWLSHWEATVHQHFTGSKADEAILRATQIGGLMKYKIDNQSSKNSLL